MSSAPAPHTTRLGVPPAAFSGVPCVIPVVGAAADTAAAPSPVLQTHGGPSAPSVTSVDVAVAVASLLLLKNDASVTSSEPGRDSINLLGSVAGSRYKLMVYHANDRSLSRFTFAGEITGKSATGPAAAFRTTLDADLKRVVRRLLTCVPYDPRDRNDPRQQRSYARPIAGRHHQGHAR